MNHMRATSIMSRDYDSDARIGGGQARVVVKSMRSRASAILFNCGPAKGCREANLTLPASAESHPVLVERPNRMCLRPPIRLRAKDPQPRGQRSIARIAQTTIRLPTGQISSVCASLLKQEREYAGAN